MTEARVVLIEALTSAPTSPVTRELRDLLGEINTRLFFSDHSSPRKKEYTVNSGDALSSIARKFAIHHRRHHARERSRLDHDPPRRKTDRAATRFYDHDRSPARARHRARRPRFLHPVPDRGRRPARDARRYRADQSAARNPFSPTVTRWKTSARTTPTRTRRSSSCSDAVMSFTAWTRTVRRVSPESK